MQTTKKKGILVKQKQHKMNKETRNVLLKIVEALFEGIKEEGGANEYALIEIEKQINEIKRRVELERKNPGGWLDLTKQQYVDLFAGVIDEDNIKKRVEFIERHDGFLKTKDNS